VTGLVGGTGIQGVTGLIGGTGIQGVTGFQGQTGIQGVTGLIGGTGIQGVTGLVGQTGIQGVTGFQSQTGIQGVTGLIGGTGIQGVTGLIGGTGIQGVTGIALGQTGIQGVTGLVGGTGIQGVTGVYAQTGIQGLTGLALGGTGIQGMTGVSTAKSYGECYFSANVGCTGVGSTTTITALGTYYIIAGTSTAGANLSNFTHASPGRLTYTGTPTTVFLVSANLSPILSTTVTRYGFRIALNGTTIPASMIVRACNNVGQVDIIKLQTLVSMETNQYVEVYVTAMTAAATITVPNLNLVCDEA
jgi:hypothetical protein